MASGLIDRYQAANQPVPENLYADTNCCLFMSCLSGVVLSYNQADLDLVIKAKRASDPDGYSILMYDQMLPLILSKTIKHHVRRVTLGTQENSTRGCNLIEELKGQTGLDASGISIFKSTEDIYVVWAAQQRHLECFATIQGVGKISRLLQCRTCSKAVNTKVDGKLYFCPSCKINMPHNRVERQFIIPLNCGASNPQLKATRDVLIELPSLPINQPDDYLMIALVGLGEVKLVYKRTPTRPEGLCSSSLHQLSLLDFVLACGEDDQTYNNAWFDEVQGRYINAYAEALEFTEQLTELKPNSVRKNDTPQPETPRPDIKQTHVESRLCNDFEAVVNLPRVELEPFDGDPLKYHTFIRTFDIMVERSCADPDARLATTKKSKKKDQTTRKRPRTNCFHQGRHLCVDTFKFLYGVSNDRLNRLAEHYEQNGLCPIENNSKGQHNQKKALPHADIEHVVKYLKIYAEDHALVLPGRVPGVWRQDVVLLPASHTKTKMYEKYKAAQPEGQAPRQYFRNSFYNKPFSTALFVSAGFDYAEWDKFLFDRRSIKERVSTLTMKEY
ncbi:hypothetical protein CAPTEDRAFT_208410 [Capitella teleta]|uniref:Uncharacterized protein n=1 Tax=Capitella teleta TaxID=283909 RepID=R7T5Z1_CAPTE|nr:hypothetical protein CAPTEDRAFT_208410 [Capitella teleta]|eukprot:ELT88889.1 hypothetical protein CAPTEDRAFT_208410 [Capitella teleta]